MKRMKLASCWKKNIPECFPRGSSPCILTYTGRFSLVSTLFFFSSTTIGIRDGRLFWSFLSESLCRSAFSSKLLSLSLLRWVTLTGILDFCRRGGRRFWLLFFSGWSHEAIAFHPRLSFARPLKYSLFCFLRFGFYSICSFWFVVNSFFLKLDCEIIQISKAPHLDTDRTDSWSKWFCFEPKSMETISYESFVI